MNSAIDRVQDFVEDQSFHMESDVIASVEFPDRTLELKRSDIHTLLSETIVSKHSILVLEYAANHIDSDNRRGIFIKAYVAGEDWAVRDFEKWRQTND